MKEVEISREPIELYKLIKFEGLASSGGEAKAMIADGQVLLNGAVETQKRKKLVSGDCIELGETTLKIRLVEAPSES
ncbi:MAG: RNA-binding S4 domain-containing protein [Lentimonas sp.]